MKRRFILACIIASLLIFTIPLASAKADTTLFGPQLYQREKGKPITITNNFSAPGYTGAGRLIINNGNRRNR